MSETNNTNKPENKDETSFRDRIATVDAKGKRKWVYAQKPKGKFYTKRTIISWLFLLVFLIMPFIQINGHPFMLFNIPKSRIILFGTIFWPQDFFIFALGLICFIIFIILFTAAFGRLFCGWVCPQTIFMEMFFRKVEYLIEGDAAQQRMLDNAPWTTDKIIKKASKHAIFYLMSFIVANFFLAYIIGVKELGQIISDPVAEHATGLLSILIFSAVFYGVFAFFREQVCTVVCPYGRLQGVLLDKNSVVVAYDYERGEERGKFKKNEVRTKGDCIDCFQCVKVCPTGIDIRNGVQMECVGCTACIDACDYMMEKVNLPKGLIRYASENGIANKEKLRYTTRMKLYTVLLCILIGILTTLLVTRKEVDAIVLRTPGLLYQEEGIKQDSLSNLYDIKVVNKTIKDVPLTVRLENQPGVVKMIGGNSVIVKKEGLGSGSFFVILPKSAIKGRQTQLVIGLYVGDKKIDQKKTNFLGYSSD